jgi:hypothetical protein
MGRRKKTIAENESSGLTRDKKAYQSRNAPESKKLGGPTEGLSNIECAIWNDLIEYMWWLNEHHRSMFELYVRMIAKMRGGDVSPDIASAIIRCSGKLGGDPSSDQLFNEPGERDADDMLNR